MNEVKPQYSVWWTMSLRGEKNCSGILSSKKRVNISKQEYIQSKGHRPLWDRNRNTYW